MSAHAVYGALTLGASLVLIVLALYIVVTTLTRRRRAAWRKFHQAETSRREQWLTGVRFAVVRRWSPTHVRLMWYVVERRWSAWPVLPIRQLLIDPPSEPTWDRGFGHWHIISEPFKAREDARREMRMHRDRPAAIQAWTGDTINLCLPPYSEGFA